MAIGWLDDHPSGGVGEPDTEADRIRIAARDQRLVLGTPAAMTDAYRHVGKCSGPVSAPVPWKRGDRD